MSKKINVSVRADQYEFLKKEAVRLKVTVARLLLIFLLDGRLTPAGIK